MAVSLTHECALWDAGADVVVGVDEVGRGALAGPVTVGMVALARCETWPEGLADSKMLTPAARVAMADLLGAFGVGRAVGHASPDEIDAHGIVAALRMAGLRALASLASAGVHVDAVLLDGKHDWLSAPAEDLFAASAGRESGDQVAPSVLTAPVTMVIGGDNLCASIAAGSVLAKVERDQMMRDFHALHPEYGWDGNKGYGSEGHLAALRERGATELHRRSWKLPGVLGA